MIRRAHFKLIALVAAIAVGAAFAGDALAKKKGKKKKKKKNEPAEVTEPPQSDSIADQLGEVRWGMNREQVLAIAIEQVKEEYAAQAAKLNDTIKEDKLFQKRDKAIKKIEKSWVEFEGQPTGWDSSVVKNEYTHQNGESMFEVRHEKWTDYYFFIANPDYDPSAGSDAPLYKRNEIVLWKVYRAFDAAMFPGLKWANIQEIMTAKFGADPYKVKKFDKDTKFVYTVGLQWQDDTTLLTLVNQFTFFGIFCLRFEDKRIHDRIDDLRVVKADTGGDSHSIIDALDEGTGTDDESNIVDILTGKGHGADNSSVQ